MVRFLKVKHFEDQRRELVARSEIHRRMLQLEMANVKYSAVLLKQRFGFMRLFRKAWRFAAPLAGGFLARKQGKAGNAAGFFGAVMSGVKMAGELLPLFKKTDDSGVREPSSSERA